ncbi:MAG: DUF2065 family protein [Xanthomonadales bacterium]|nr:DUF2065 family protein [Xanthomonadales bacterium]
MREGIEIGVALLLLMLGLSYLLRTPQWIGFLRRLAREPRRVLPLALGLVAAGAFIGVGYNDWTSRPAIFITALGWLMVLEGLLLLLRPAVVRWLNRPSTGFLSRYLRFGGLLLVAIGLVLLAQRGR